MQYSSAGFSASRRNHKQEHKHDEAKEEIVTDDGFDAGDAFDLACDFFRQHPLLVHIDPDKDSPSSAVTDIIDDFLRDYPAFIDEDISIFVEALMASVHTQSE